MGVCNCSMFCCTLLYVHSCIAIILMIRESWLLCLICLPGVSWWLSGSSLRCHGVVCSLWLWYFLIILTIFAQFLLFESKFDHLITHVNESKPLRRVSGQDPFICHRFRSSQRWWQFSPLSSLGKWSNFDQFSLFESNFDHLIPYVNEIKSLRRVSGQDPLICHRFRSSQRWWHFSPLSRLRKMEQFCAISAVWV